MGAVKVFHSDQVGAPVLNGIIGSLVTVMDAVLVNGFNQQPVTSIVRVGSLCTVTVATGHGYDNPNVRWWNKNGVGNYCLITGADQPEYNGEWAITYVDTVTFTFDIGTATPTTPATGTIITKRAPAGWAKPYADTNRAAYRSTDPTSRRHYLYVNDLANCPNNQGARYAGWRGFEKMSGLDLWEYPFPTMMATSFGPYFCKSSGLDASSRAWTIISDGKFIVFYVGPAQGGADFSANAYARIYGFGDILTTSPDPYATLLCADSGGSNDYSTISNSGLMYPSQSSNSGIPGSGWACLARRYNGQATPVFAAGLVGASLSQNSLECFGFRSFLNFPHPSDNLLYLTQIKVTDNSTLRGVIPLYESAHGVQHSNREIITNVKGMEGKHLLYLRAGPGNSSYTGGIFIDITGPWS